MDDAALLRDYVVNRSDAAFESLVLRHVNLVYSAAMRQVKDPHVAEEISQVVFIILARKAASLGPGTILPIWLLRTVRFAAATERRNATRRLHMLKKAQVELKIEQEMRGEGTWELLEPLLDDAIAGLNERDRAVLVLRYFDGQSFENVGLALGIDPATARKRVERALAKLRRGFAKRGVAVAVGAMGAMLAANAVQAAPQGVGATAVAIALKGTAATASSSALVTSTLKLMSWAKLKIALATGISVLLTAGATAVTVQEIKRRGAFDWEIPNFTAATLNATAPQVTIVPSKYPNVGQAVVSGSDSAPDSPDDARLMGIGMSLESILQITHHAAGDRHVVPAGMPAGTYDFIANFPAGSRPALARLIEHKLGWMAERETRPVQGALAIRLNHPGTPGLKPAALGTGIEAANGKRLLRSRSAAQFADFLTSALGVPVVDKTGLSGPYDFEFTLLAQPGDNHDTRIEWARKVLLADLGLELVPHTGQEEVLVFRRAR